MRTSIILSTLAALLPLAASEACVAGGPAAAVTAAHACCDGQKGTWYQFYDVQAICVFDDWRTYLYKACIAKIPDVLLSKLDTTCIPGTGPSGPTGPVIITSTTSARTTLTAASSATLTAAA